MSTRRLLAAAVALMSEGACGSAVDASPADRTPTPAPSEFFASWDTGQGVDVVAGGPMTIDLAFDDECLPVTTPRTPAPGDAKDAELRRFSEPLFRLVNDKRDLFTGSAWASDYSHFVVTAPTTRWEQAMAALKALQPARGQVLMVPVDYSVDELKALEDAVPQSTWDRLGVESISLDMRGFITVDVRRNLLTHTDNGWQPTGEAERAEMAQLHVGCVAPSDGPATPASGG